MVTIKTLSALQCWIYVIAHHLSFSINPQGFNPMIRLTFSPTSNYTDIYQITQEGLIIAKTNQVKPNQKHILEVSLG